MFLSQLLFVLSFLLCCFHFFFFFKQKTAYEMRISDWSSDVCSSDLRGGPDHVVAQGVTTPTAQRILMRFERCLETLLVAEAQLQRRLQAQIGRASCRERVCQYV